ncbi:hypothetical protein HHK36_026424 [Tetracentron sinense]|uniref:HMA domain-containing protein n=1 Tax=Tetracentron sinense TaxID=13715 RepID=A0A835D5G9_TETSI|nr:hypothetical protein HHK36_026424 [Tetracentron sinense]
MQKPRVTEIMVRMDCNGCVQKIKKALHGIKGIYEVYIDCPQQKVTVVGWADPEKIIKAIKKTRKMASICSHTIPTDPAPQPTEAAPESGPPPPDAGNPPTVSPPAEAAPPEEPPKDPPPPENPPPEVTPSPLAADTAAQQSAPKDVEEVHIIYHHPPDYGYGHRYSHSGGNWNNYPNYHGFQLEPPPPVYEPLQPVHVTHSYNTYKPSPHITEYEYIRPPLQHTHYNRTEHYSEDYRNRSNSNGNNISSMFSDENPNACRIA